MILIAIIGLVSVVFYVVLLHSAAESCEHILLDDLEERK